MAVLHKQCFHQRQQHGVIVDYGEFHRLSGFHLSGHMLPASFAGAVCLMLA